MISFSWLLRVKLSFHIDPCVQGDVRSLTFDTFQATHCTGHHHHLECRSSLCQQWGGKTRYWWLNNPSSCQFSPHHPGWPWSGKASRPARQPRLLRRVETPLLCQEGGEVPPQCHHLQLHWREFHWDRNDKDQWINGVVFTIMMSNTYEIWQQYYLYKRKHHT